MFVAAKLFHKAGEGSGGGSDPHNLGYYADLTALQTAYPTGTDGDFAILGSTDTIWVWDSGTSAWKDTDTKGQVTSVNNQTGAVTLGINDVAPTQTGKSGYVLGTDGFVAGWVKPEIVQVSALPTASADEVDNIYQFVGTTDANYTNGYFYKCVSDGQDPATYSWTQTDVQPQAGGLPSQTGQSGKFLTTDGTDASWSDKPLVNTATGSNLTILGTAPTSSSIWGSINIGVGSNLSGEYSIAVGRSATASRMSLSLGFECYAAANSICIGTQAKSASGGITLSGSAVGEQTSLGGNSIFIGSQGSDKLSVGFGSIMLSSGVVGSGSQYNVPAGTFVVGLTTQANQESSKYVLLNSDGTIPTDRFTTTPVADGTYVPTLTIASGVATRSWTAPSGGSTALSLTLAAANWSNNTITVTATGVTASNNVIVSPAPASQADYTAAGIICTGQSTNSLTFTCTTTPSSDLTVTVLII